MAFRFKGGGGEGLAEKPIRLPNSGEVLDKEEELTKGNYCGRNGRGFY